MKCWWGSITLLRTFAKHLFDLLLKHPLGKGIALFDPPLAEGVLLLQCQTFGLLH